MLIPTSPKLTRYSTLSTSHDFERFVCQHKHNQCHYSRQEPLLRFDHCLCISSYFACRAFRMAEGWKPQLRDSRSSLSPLSGTFIQIRETTCEVARVAAKRRFLPDGRDSRSYVPRWMPIGDKRGNRFAVSPLSSYSRMRDFTSPTGLGFVSAFCRPPCTRGRRRYRSHTRQPGPSVCWQR